MSELKEPLYQIYSGTAPYAFISYAHGDAQKVLPVIGAMGGERVRLWYDGGIEAGTDWPEAVASHLQQAGAAVFFLSARFLRSQNCVREVHYAVAQSKRMICVYLEDVALPKDLAMQFSTAAVLPGADGDGQRIARELTALLGPAFLGDGATGYVPVPVRRRPKNVWRGLSLLFASFFLLTVLFVVGYFADWFPSLGARTVTVEAAGSPEAGEPLKITTFKDAVSQDILLRAYEGDSLYLCGDTLLSDPSAIRCRDGAWYAADVPVRTGRPEALALAAQKKTICYLALVDQGVESFDALSAMPQLVYLDISGNPVRDLSFLSALTDLKTLKLIHVPATAYDALAALPALETVYVDLEAAEAVLDALGDRPVYVIVCR